MSDSLVRANPVPDDFVAAGIAIRLAPPMARYSLRARMHQTLEALLGAPVPKSIGATLGGVAQLGPDEWLLRADAGFQIAPDDGLAVAVTNVSERSVCLIVEGPRAATVLMAGCPLDLDKFAVGRATRTVFETVEIILIRTADDQFQVEVWRSFGPWLWAALAAAASQ